MLNYSDNQAFHVELTKISLTSTEFVWYLTSLRTHIRTEYFFFAHLTRIFFETYRKFRKSYVIIYKHYRKMQISQLCEISRFFFPRNSRLAIYLIYNFKHSKKNLQINKYLLIQDKNIIILIVRDGWFCFGGRYFFPKVFYISGMTIYFGIVSILKNFKMNSFNITLFHMVSSDI